MIPNPYNTSQWNWIADRLEEGYKMRDMEEFLGMTDNSVRYNLIELGRRLPPEDRIPLNERKKEFNALAGDGSPPVNHYLKSVIGTDKEGNEVYFDSVADAERFLGLRGRGQVYNAIRNGRRCRGYKWRKAEV